MEALEQKIDFLILTSWLRFDYFFVIFLDFLFAFINILIIFFSSMKVTEIVTQNLNKIIDINYYPVETARRSNLRHRPIGIGVQGLADTFILLGLAFDSAEVSAYLKIFLLIKYLLF